jgi:hypothetical protein
MIEVSSSIAFRDKERVHMLENGVDSRVICVVANGNGGIYFVSIGAD